MNILTNNIVKSIVIVGGGSAGWITAGVLASRFQGRIKNSELQITLCESPNIPTVGVGEGTWPTMVSTLKNMGISESDFIKECEVSFKQGSKFVGWDNDQGNGFYYHPFDDLQHSVDGVFAEYWLDQLKSQQENQVPNQTMSFAKQFSVQHDICENALAPKSITDAEYSSATNYGYHLNAGLFSSFLQKHCIEKLGVNHVLAEVNHIQQNAQGDITQLELDNKTTLQGDLFIDCTGFRSLLLGQTLGVKLKPVNDILFADTALATQVQYNDDNAPIVSCTKSTAQDAGWIWDIGLPTRRGVGHVFSSKHTTKEKAQDDLLTYIKSTGGNTDNLTIREINFQSGYREKFWQNNCVAVGLSAGFLEPLEASALVLVELSAMMIAEQLPLTSEVMDISAQRFNDKFHYRWERAIDFLKLHYVLSNRTSPFWLDNKKPETIPERLQGLLKLWQHKIPNGHDFEATGELFQATSYQFVLYGSQFRTLPLFELEPYIKNYVAEHVSQKNNREQQLLSSLPTNRDLLNKIHKYGLSKI
ncbi:tryptophan halogenase family protein [Thalassotalea agariperforans]